MKLLSSGAKQAIIDQVVANGGHVTRDIAKSYNIGYSTLQKWISNYYKGGNVSNRFDGRANKSLSNFDKLLHIKNTYRMSETEKGAYCRENGLYSFQLDEWEAEFTKDNISIKNNPCVLENKQLKEENKQLKKELAVKDSALAKASTMLILKKKSQMIWGELEDD